MSRHSAGRRVSYLQYFLSLTFLSAVQLSASKIIMLSRRQQARLQSWSALVTGVSTLLVTASSGEWRTNPSTSSCSSSIHTNSAASSWQSADYGTIKYITRKMGQYYQCGL